MCTLMFSLELGSSPKNHTSSSSEKNAKSARHAPRKGPIHLHDTFHKKNRNLEQLGILEPVKEVTEWINSFVIMDKMVPIDSSNSHLLGQCFQETLNLP